MLGTYNDGITQTLVSAIGGVPMGIGIFLVWPLAKKFGKRNVTLAGFILYSIGSHYAGGAAGDWLYRRVAGIEAVDGGYKTFRIAPLPGGGITWARGSVLSPYGEIVCEWRIENGKFSINIQVPVSTKCLLTLPNGGSQTLASGKYSFSCSEASFTA